MVIMCTLFGNRSAARASTLGKTGPYINPTIEADNAFSNTEWISQMQRCIEHATAIKKWIVYLRCLNVSLWYWR